MEGIISFISDNIFWLVIAFFVLSGFGKSKKKRAAPPPAADEWEEDAMAEDAWQMEDDWEGEGKADSPWRSLEKDIEQMPKPLRDLARKVEDWIPADQKPNFPGGAMPWSQPQTAATPRREERPAFSGASQPSKAGGIRFGKTGEALAVTSSSPEPAAVQIAVSPERVREAVVWAEILGPPKARRRPGQR